MAAAGNDRRIAGAQDPYDVRYDASVTDNPRHQALLDWWQARRGDRPAPPRSALDPVELRRHMGALVLIECLPGLVDFRYRLIGTNITAAYGRDSTGRTVADLYAEDATYRDFLLTTYRTVASRCLTARGFGDLRTVGREYRRFDTYLLPLARDDGSIGWILNQVLFD
jgi:hypothetical protein